ncbi:hypothetical protein [Paenibacillus hamazuiensis]|uniref:hypothetical protein n=1 Tax=Paenibacillus hamazuiensis TaxID=2936508 RepID=UPI00200C0CC6|nr:hypothetical protein [Paenibacillus hamazuiensis]
MKMKKLVSVLPMIIALLTFSQAAFAGATPITWDNYTDYGRYNCNPIPQVSDGEVSVNSMIENGSYCYGVSRGETYVENLNQVVVNFYGYLYNRGSNFTVDVYGGNSIYSTRCGCTVEDINSYYWYDYQGDASESDDFYDTLIIDVTGYSGPINFYVDAGISNYSGISNGGTAYARLDIEYR